MTEFLNAALDLADRGFRVFPLRPNGKLPAIKKFPQLATRDEAIIREWWRRRPECNVGILTGDYGNGEWVTAVDVDVKDGKDGFAAVLQLELDGKEFPPTYTQRTTTGGEHYVYKANQKLRQTAGVLGKGIDTRSEGGFIVGAGSEVGGKLYVVANDPGVQPVPAWMAHELAVTHERASDAGQGDGDDCDGNVSRVDHYLDNEAPLSVEGDRGDTIAYKVAARVKDLGVSQPMAYERMAEKWNPRCSPPWDADALLDKVKHAYRYGQNPVGSSDPRKDFKAEHQNNDPAAVPTTSSPDEAETPAPKGLPFKAFADIEPDIARPALVKGWLDEGGFSLPYGPFGSGKTLVLLHMELHVAMGWEWMGCKVQQGAVVHFALEGGKGVDRRVKALKIKHGLEGRDVPLYVVKAPINLGKKTTAGSDVVIETLREIEKASGQRVVLCVIDTVNRAMAATDENDSSAVGAFTSHIDRIRYAIGCHVAAIHHTGKDASRGARGSSAWGGNSDTMIFIEKGKISIPDDPDRGKQRDGKTGGAIGFNVVEVPLGKDVDGDVVTSAVIEPAALPPSKRGAFKPGSGPDRVMKLMFEAEKDGKKVSPQPGRLKLHQGARVFPRKLIRELFVDEKMDLLDEKAGIEESALRRKKEAWHEAFRAAAEELKRAGYVNFDKEYLWFS